MQYWGMTLIQIDYDQSETIYPRLQVYIFSSKNYVYLECRVKTDELPIDRQQMTQLGPFLNPG